MDSELLLTGLEAVEVEGADSQVREQTQEAFASGDGEHGEALRAMAEIDLQYREFIFEVYDQFCETLDGMGVDHVPDVDQRRRLATLGGKVAQKNQYTWIKHLGVEGALIGALCAQWGPALWQQVQPQIKQALRNVKKRNRDPHGNGRQRKDDGARGQ